MLKLGGGTPGGALSDLNNGTDEEDRNEAPLISALKAASERPACSMFPICAISLLSLPLLDIGGVFLNGGILSGCSNSDVFLGKKSSQIFHLQVSSR